MVEFFVDAMTASSLSADALASLAEQFEVPATRAKSALFALQWSKTGIKSVQQSLESLAILVEKETLKNKFALNGRID